MDCLKNIVGLSPTSCNCWDDTKPVDFSTQNESSSGLYVSQPDTISLRWTNSASDCESGGVWDMLISARDSAVRDVLQGFLEQVGIKHEERFLPFTKIGDDYYKMADSVKQDYAACWIEPYQIKGGRLKIESIALNFFSGIDNPIDVDIMIYSSLDFVNSLGTATASITSNKQYFTAVFNSPILIDLSNIRTDLNQRFYFVYQIPSGAFPIKNATKIGCGCNGQGYEQNPYLQLMELGGAQSSTIEGFENPSYKTSTMQGMYINASLECDYYSWLCNLAQKPFENTVSLGSGQFLRLGMILADTIQAKAVVNLIDALIKNSRINQYTMIQGTEELYQTRNHFDKIFNLGIENLVYYMPKTTTDCLVCRNDSRLNKSQILI